MRAKRDLRILRIIPILIAHGPSHEPLSQTLRMAGIGRSRAGPMPLQKNSDSLEIPWHPGVQIPHCR